MAENTDPQPLEGNEEIEEIEVVAHSEEEEDEAGCIINNSSELN